MTARPAAMAKLPKKDRKALARELARIERERQAQRRRRKRRLRWAGAGTAAVAAGVVAVLAWQASVRAGQVGPLNMASDGIVLGGDGSAVAAVRTAALDSGASPTATTVDRASGVLDLVLYLDYGSADAATFWSANGAAVEQWVTAGYATLEVHPLALADDAGGDAAGDASLRAAGALACVADTTPDAALTVHDALLAAQPDLAAGDLDDDALVALVEGAGVTDEAVADCISSGSFTDWAREATDRAAQAVPFDVGAVSTSPVLQVAGQEYTGALDDPDALTAFIEQVSTQLAEEAAAAEATASPSPTP